ncbi:hypothetical protein PF002_g31564 [Phytophthora fragariae]|uniref:Uncharacterized protein n=2 Tax=Phytophthora fragariae TaxID=53985 RepID=A0A6A3VFM4_9STRA|nr:hypothetical protein PF002_g31564 [Phytophthora fragariae]
MNACPEEDAAIKTPAVKRRTKRERGWPSTDDGGKSGRRGGGETELPVLGKRRRGDEVVTKASGESAVAKTGGEKTSGESIDARASVESTGAKTDGESKSAAVDMELGTVYVSTEVTEDVRQDVTSEHAEASVIAQCGSTAADDGAEEEQKLPIPDGVRRQTEKMSGGRTTAAR